MVTLPSTPTGTKWLGLRDSKTGKSHVMRDKPNQDAYDLRHLHKGRAGIIVVVSDGHGGERYVRSQQGAAIAAKAAGKYLRERLAPYWKAPSASIRVSLTELQDEVPRYLLRLWQSGVREHMASSPWNENEKEFGWDKVSIEDAYTAYGATLLFAAALPGFVLYGQLGDGDLLKVSRDGEVVRAIPRSESSFANETLSLCSPSAAVNMVLSLQRYEVGSLRPEEMPPELIFLATDGYSNSFKSDEGFLQNVAGIHEYLKTTDGYRNVGQSLPHWVDHCAQSGSGDDVTVALLFPESLISKSSS